MTAPAFSQAQPSRTIGQRARSSKPQIAFVILLVLVVGLMVATRSETNSVPSSINNPTLEGAQAVARVAAAQGLNIREITSLSAARITDPANTTLVLIDPYFYIAGQGESIRNYPGDIVVFGMPDSVAEAFGLDIWIDLSGDFSSLFGDSVDATDRYEAQCEDPHAQAAGALQARPNSLLTEGLTTCFPSGEGDLVAIHEENGRTVTFVADSFLVSNRNIALEGNAAYVLRLIGAHDNAVWYLSDGYDTSMLTWTSPDGSSSAQQGDGTGAGEPSVDFMPPGFGNLLYALGLGLIVVVWWRARRFGPLVTEPLPVVIKASEAMRGRARLYRASGATGRAGASLRAETATRIASRLGVSRQASSDAFISAVAGASRQSPSDIRELFYGPAPATESELRDLALALDQVEREVHRL